MGLHALVGMGDVHKAHNWEYADATTRLAATGFVTADLHKLALQLDDATYWILLSISPITWGQINPPDPENVATLKISCIKSTAGSIAKGSVVYAVGGMSGVHVLVEKAKADSAATMPACGVLEDNITEAVSGHAVCSGRVSGLNTPAVRSKLYVSATTAGALATARPTGTALVQSVAEVIVSDVTNGVLGVRMDWPVIAPNFAAFDEKNPLALTDLFLIEQADGVQKRAQYANVHRAPALIYSSEDAEDTTTSTDWVQAWRYSPTVETGATYLLLYAAEISNSSDSIATLAQIQINDATTFAEWQKMRGADYYAGYGGHYVFTAAGTSVNIDFDFKASGGAGTAKIRRKRIALLKIVG